jgi:hypothetical protein
LLLSKPQKNLIKNELQNKKILVDKMKKKINLKKEKKAKQTVVKLGSLS